MKTSTMALACFVTAGVLFLAMCDMGKATPWTVPDGEGGWKPNPECSSSNCHETGNPDPVKPTPEPEPPTPPVDPKPEPEQPGKPDVPYRGGNGRDPAAYTGATAFKTCCVHEGVRYATPRLFRSKRAASTACAAVANPPACFPLTDPAPYTGSLK